MRIIAISDTHALHQRMSEAIPDGDLLIHSGDLTNIGEPSDVKNFAKWSKNLTHKHKVIIAGNHDFCFDPASPIMNYNSDTINYLQDSGWIYLHDSTCIIENLNIYGSPYQPWFYNWAFNKYRGQDIKTIWDKIPLTTDILVTHGPPHGILDKTATGFNAGCEELLKKIKIIKPKLHIFGHIHEGYGVTKFCNTTFINASICTLDYKPINSPILYTI